MQFKLMASMMYADYGHLAREVKMLDKAAMLIMHILAILKSMIRPMRTVRLEI